LAPAIDSAKWRRGECTFPTGGMLPAMRGLLIYWEQRSAALYAAGIIELLYRTIEKVRQPLLSPADLAKWLFEMSNRRGANPPV
jgi:hypothetical protein